MTSKTSPASILHRTLVGSGVLLVACGAAYLAAPGRAATGSVLLSMSNVGDKIDPVTGKVVQEGDEQQVAKGTSAEPVPADSKPNVVQGRTALLMQILMLEKARDNISKFSGYHVNFHKQERINGRLNDPQLIEMDIRHEPFSVYMNWKTAYKGQQVLFVPSENDGKAVVRLGGFKGRLLGPVRVKPDGPQAMADSRYPLTKAGILPVIDLILEHRQTDLKQMESVDCEMTEHEMMHGRRCFKYSVRYASKAACELYRESIVYIDETTLVPVRITNYTWARDAEDLTVDEFKELTLIEDYAFSDLKVRSKKVALETFKNRKL